MYKTCKTCANALLKELEENNEFYCPKLHRLIYQAGTTCQYYTQIKYNIMKAVKKPVVIDFIHFLGHNYDEVSDFLGYTPVIDNKGIIIKTLEDGDDNQVQHFASVGDYIIKGIKGEFYPCKPDIFESSYDALDI